MGSTTNKFRLSFNDHKTRVNRHERLNEAEREKDDVLYKHFWSEGNRGLRDLSVQLIDRVNSEGELRDKEGQWAYKLKSVKPGGLNNNDFFFLPKQAHETRAVKTNHCFFLSSRDCLN